MGFFNTVQSIIKTALDQLSATGSATMHFTNHFREQARSWGLTEKDARDVYQHGDQVKENMLMRTYNGYEIGIYTFKDKRTGQPVISSIWKRKRR